MLTRTVQAGKWACIVVSVEFVLGGSVGVTLTLEQTSLLSTHPVRSPVEDDDSSRQQRCPHHSIRARVDVVSLRPLRRQLKPCVSTFIQAFDM